MVEDTHTVVGAAVVVTTVMTVVNVDVPKAPVEVDVMVMGTVVETATVTTDVVMMPDVEEALFAMKKKRVSKRKYMEEDEGSIIIKCYYRLLTIDSGRRSWFG